MLLRHSIATVLIALAMPVLACRPSPSSSTSTATSTAKPAATATATRAAPPGQTLTIGSKGFSEQRLLGAILKAHLEQRLNHPVELKTYDNTEDVNAALRSGKIALYPEYTGTALTAILGKKSIHDAPAALAEMTRLYAADGLDCLAPLGFENSFVLVINGARARRDKIRTLSQAAARPEMWRLGMGPEFQRRPDGLKGLVERYSLRLAPVQAVLDLDRLFHELEEDHVDMIPANATDGLLSVLDVTVLEDDRHYFPPYQAVIAARRDALEHNRGLREALEELTGKFPVERMRYMNYEVDGRHRQVADVAAEFLKSAAMRGPS